jgi:LPS export ABC transporter permease LptG
MTLIDRYLVRRMLATILKVLFGLVFLFVTIDLLTHRQDSIVKYEIPWAVVGEYYLTFIPRILFEYQAIPMAVLVAGLMVLGRAAQDNEITAALAGGIGLRRIAAGPIVLSILIAVFSLVVQETAGARAIADARRIEQEYFSRFDETTREGVSWNGLGDGWMCYTLKFNHAALTGQDVYIHKITPERFEEIRARRLWWSEAQGQWMIEDGTWMGFDRGRDWEQMARRITQEPAPFAESPASLFALDAPANTKGLGTLGDDIARAESLGLPTTSARVDYWAKLARPTLAIIMMLIAVPFAVRMRRGGLAAGFGISIVVGIVYVLLFYGGLGLGYLAIVPPFLAAWTANAIFFTGGLWMLLRAPS